MKPHPLIAREGWAILAGLTAVWLACLWWLPMLSWVVLILLVFSLQFFRDPRRVLVVEPGVVTSPADGRIVSVMQCPDPFTKQLSLKVSVFMNVFNVHSNRIPVAGKIEQQQYFAGNFVNAAMDKASEHNERNALQISTSNGLISVVQVAGLVARRILCYLQPGDVVEQGQRYGFIRFGSRVDVYLPPNSQALVFPGDKVSAGVTRIARFS